MKLFDNYDEFRDYVGILDETADWKTIGIEPDNGMYFSTDRLHELLDFIKRNPKYHIVTWTSDGDDDETTFDNEVRIVNRLEYMLANGSKKPAFLTEKSEVM